MTSSPTQQEKNQNNMPFKKKQLFVQFHSVVLWSEYHVLFLDWDINEVGEGWVAGVDGGEGDEVGWEVSVAREGLEKKRKKKREKSI